MLDLVKLEQFLLSQGDKDIEGYVIIFLMKGVRKDEGREEMMI